MAAASFGNTVISGIQDISALLPLLGTEQCEEHVGSTLDKGFLYAAVTPISIFGSLGIVRAAFNTLVTGVRVPKRFLGARHVRDGGFAPKGSVASMTAMDPKNVNRLLAESRLEDMIAKDHIENIEDLSVDWDNTITTWNISLVLVTFLLSSIGVIPYLGVILFSIHPHGIPVFPSGWGFPILRVLGSALCVIVIQFMLQRRILVIMRTRLLFMKYDKWARMGEPGRHMENPHSQGINLSEASQIDPNKILAVYTSNSDLWNSSAASEECIWELERWLETKISARGFDAISDTERPNFIHTLQLVRKESAECLGTLNTSGWLLLHRFIFRLLLVAGALMIIVGYVGCFNLIQHPKTDRALDKPLGIWLILEAGLSLIRIAVWATNPSWDECKGILFSMKLSPRRPLITSSKSRMYFEETGAAPVFRANAFLKDIVAYKGLFTTPNWDGIELYYLFLGGFKDDSKLWKVTNVPIPGQLYIVVSKYKERMSRIACQDQDGKLHLFVCDLLFRSTSGAISVKVDFSAGPAAENTHFFGTNDKFMDELMAHYEEVIRRLVRPHPDDTGIYKFSRPWNMLRPIDDKHKHLASGTWPSVLATKVRKRPTNLKNIKSIMNFFKDFFFFSNLGSSERLPDHLSLSRFRPRITTPVSLEQDDIEYFNQGKLEKQGTTLLNIIEEEYIIPYIFQRSYPQPAPAKDLLEELVLIIHLAMNAFAQSVQVPLHNYLQSHHNHMVDSILTERAATGPLAISNLRNRLERELEEMIRVQQDSRRSMHSRRWSNHLTERFIRAGKTVPRGRLKLYEELVHFEEPSSVLHISGSWMQRFETLFREYFRSPLAQIIPGYDGFGGHVNRALLEIKLQWTEFHLLSQHLQQASTSVSLLDDSCGEIMYWTNRDVLTERIALTKWRSNFYSVGPGLMSFRHCGDPSGECKWIVRALETCSWPLTFVDVSEANLPEEDVLELLASVTTITGINLGRNVDASYACELAMKANINGLMVDSRRCAFAYERVLCAPTTSRTLGIANRLDLPESLESWVAVIFCTSEGAEMKSHKISVIYYSPSPETHTVNLKLNRDLLPSWPVRSSVEGKVHEILLPGKSLCEGKGSRNEFKLYFPPSSSFIIESISAPTVA